MQSKYFSIYVRNTAIITNITAALLVLVNEENTLHSPLVRLLLSLLLLHHIGCSYTCQKIHMPQKLFSDMYEILSKQKWF